MERLAKLAINGFRSIRETDIDLRDITLLVGANGSGKSNVVAFLEMLSHAMNGDLRVYVARNGGASALLHYGPNRTSEMFGLLGFDGEDVSSGKYQRSYIFSLAHSAPDRLVFASEETCFMYAGEGGEDRGSHLGSGHVESLLPHHSSQSVETQTHEASRALLSHLKNIRTYHFHDTTNEAPIRCNHDVNHNRSLLGNGGNLAAFLHALGRAYPAHYERIVSTVRLVLPHFKDFVLDPNIENPNTIILRWRDQNPDYVFGVHHLSDGSLRAIALITLLLQPEKMLPSVIVIDEPELGLHPSAVRLIADLLKDVASKRQVIVATQSSRLAREFAPEDIVVVERIQDDRGHAESRFQRLSTDALGDWVKEYDLGELMEMNVTGGAP
ncbi:MAG: AAA family ATPase [Planctomycetes bacterium]|nr:AAA family ATPase [Planctomycetota bacterium]